MRARTAVKTVRKTKRLKNGGWRMKIQKSSKKKHNDKV